jgi:hypothetical protein
MIYGFFSYPNWNAVRTELSWTHYRPLLRVDNLDARSWYQQEAIQQHWSAGALERQSGISLVDVTALASILIQ